MVSLLSKLKKGIEKTKSQVFNRIVSVISTHGRIDDDLLEEIEEILITGDVGVETSLELIDNIKKRIKRENCQDPQDLFRLLKEEIIKLFPEDNFVEYQLTAKPYVILVVGVNGTGKTTSIAKLAYRFRQAGKSVILAAADTFRAAAIEQLQEWANRIAVDVVKQKSGADPGAVVFDALQAARARDRDVVIIDTAGRLHTKINLMEELKKIKRVIQKVIPDAPHRILLVLDATTGQNALNQARQFVETIGVTGIILAKLDGTAKGGAVLGISHQLNIPVNYIGLGERIDDLEIFVPRLFVEGLFGTEEKGESGQD